MCVWVTWSSITRARDTLALGTGGSYHTTVGHIHGDTVVCVLRSPGHLDSSPHHPGVHDRGNHVSLYDLHGEAVTSESDFGLNSSCIRCVPYRREYNIFSMNNFDFTRGLRTDPADNNKNNFHHHDDAFSC